MNSGSPSTARKSISWTTADTQAYLANLAVGILAGIAITFARTPLHLPGHKALFWIVPVLAGRLLTGAGAGAFLGACATAGSAMALGGRIASGVAMLPLLGLAGAVLDVVAWKIGRDKTTPFVALMVLSMAGAIGNLICFVNRIFEPNGALFSSRNVHEFISAAGWYLVFGLTAGFIGAVIGIGVLRMRKFGDSAPKS